jgi:hypothetical protein
LARAKTDALFVGPGKFFNTRRVELVELTARYAIPAAYPVCAYPDVGGLMSYGTEFSMLFAKSESMWRSFLRAPIRRTCLFTSRPSSSW